MKAHKSTRKTNVIDNQDAIGRVILNMARKRKQTIYGARSIKAQNNMFGRETQDYDVFDKNPKQVAKLIQKELDQSVGFDYFYHKEAKHKGTWKVKGRGVDMRKNTEDDESIADYSKPDGKVPFVLIDGIRYRVLKKELERKRAVAKDPEYKFRHEKDRDDINRIKGFIKIKKLLR